MLLHLAFPTATFDVSSTICAESKVYSYFRRSLRQCVRTCASFHIQLSIFALVIIGDNEYYSCVIFPLCVGEN